MDRNDRSNRKNLRERTTVFHSCRRLTKESSECCSFFPTNPMYFLLTHCTNLSFPVQSLTVLHICVCICICIYSVANVYERNRSMKQSFMENAKEKFDRIMIVLLFDGRFDSTEISSKAPIVWSRLLH